MDYYQTGKIDGKAQFEMDKLTDSIREGDLLVYTANGSCPPQVSEEMLPFTYCVWYVGGFVEGYLLAQLEHPIIVCLCGSTRFSEAFQQANLRETLAGRIVLSIGCDFKSDDALGLTEADKERLDELHLRKIDLADQILVLNVSGYVGKSTANEIRYAEEHGKCIRWLEPRRLQNEYGV